MRLSYTAMLAAALLFLPGQVAADHAKPAEWRSHATVTDQVRIDEWESSLVSAVLFARDQGEGDLYQRDRPLYSPVIPEDQRPLGVGLYLCRSIQIEKEVVRGLAYVAYQQFRCRVTKKGSARYFEKLTGSQRTKGRIYAASDIEGEVYLGVEQLADDKTWPKYGERSSRNDAGVVQSIDEERWRIVFPGAVNNGRVNILELVPLYCEATATYADMC